MPVTRNNGSDNQKANHSTTYGADLPARVLDALKRSVYWTDKTRESGASIHALTCPECGKAESAWAYRDRPFSINCNRLNQCGARVKTLQLFPEVLRRIEQDYPPTETDPHRPARAFLESRGLSGVLDGLSFEYWRDVRKTGTGAVMFPVSMPEGKTSWNGRLFNPPKGAGKTHNKGTTKGGAWRHPARDYDPAAETFVTEGIIDALSLMEMGFQAVAILASGQDPEAVDLSAFRDLVFAFDNDPAGHRALKKWKAAHPKAGAVMAARGKDWNDLLLQWGPKAAKKFPEKRKRLEFNAELALCETPEDYAAKFEDFHDRPAGLFEFGGKTHYASDKGVSMVGDFTLQVDHFQRIETNPDAIEFRYRVKVRPERGRPSCFTVTAGEISSKQKLTTTFLQRARTLWTGGEAATYALLRRITNSKAPVIRQLDRIGLDLESGCYVFPKYMINARGETRSLEDGHDFFKEGRQYIRPARIGEEVLKPVERTAPREMYRRLVGAWGERAAVSFAWMVACWFITEVKPYTNGFPFLSLYGDPQTGKSMLTRKLSNWQGFGQEGIPMTGSTDKGIKRHLAKRAGLFLGLLEETMNRKSKFDFYNIMLNLYSGFNIEERASFSNDNQTNTVDCYAGLMFVQNVEPFITRPQRERVVSLEFRRSQLNDGTAQNFESLVQISPDAFAWGYPFIMTRQQEIRGQWAAEYERARKDLADGIPDPRIRQNHAIVLGFHHIVREIMGFPEYDIRPFLEDIGKRKIDSCQTSDNPIADLFFETLLDEIEEGRAGHYADLREDLGRLYVRMNEACKEMRDRMGLGPKDITEALKHHPAVKRTSLTHRFWSDTRAISKKSTEFDMNLIGCCNMGDEGDERPE